MSSSAFTTALVLETHNIQRGGEAGALTALSNLLTHLKRQLETSVDEICVTHFGLSDAAQRQVEQMLGASVRWLCVDEITSYYEAKNAGFQATKADVVVFADSDCWPDTSWLGKLLSPFADANTKVVAGRTRYRDDVLGDAVTLLDFPYFERHCASGRITHNFYANNVAFRRDVFAEHNYPEDAFFRGHCQVLGMRLAEAGVAIRYQHDAVTVHRFPDSARELLVLRLLRGSDLRALAPRIAEHLELPVSPALSVPAAWLVRQSFAMRTERVREQSLIKRLQVNAICLGVAGLDAAGVVFAGRVGANPHTLLSYQNQSERFGAA